MQTIGDLIHIPIQSAKPLQDREKKWIVQNEIFEIYLKQDLRIENRNRCMLFIKQNQWQGRHTRDQWIKLWKKHGSKETKRLRPLTKKSFGFYTAHLKWDELFAVKSVCLDKLHREESIHCYLMSLNSPIKAT